MRIRIWVKAAMLILLRLHYRMPTDFSGHLCKRSAVSVHQRHYGVIDREYWHVVSQLDYHVASGVAGWVRRTTLAIVSLVRV
jgi:hypothetical protein